MQATLYSHTENAVGDLRLRTYSGCRRQVESRGIMKTRNRMLLNLVVMVWCSTWIYSYNAAPAADLLISNAKVWTGDASRPWAQAVAVLGDRIVAVGKDAELERWKGPKTQIIDAGSHLLLPGFNDAHVHFQDGGMQLDSIQL